MEEEKKNQEENINPVSAPEVSNEIKEEKTINNEPTNEVNVNKQQDLMPVKNNNGLVVGLIILVILLAGGLVYMLFFNKDKEEGKKNENNTPTVTPEPIKNDVTPTPIPQENDTDKKYELTVYKYKDDGRINSYNKPDNYVEPAFTIKVSTQTAKVVDVDDDGLFVIYSDDGIKIYNVKNKSKQDTNLSSEYSNYDAYLNEEKNKVIGIGFTDKNYYVGYYNVTTGKELYYDKKYKNDDYPFLYQINDNYLSLYTDDYAYLLSAKEEKIVLSHKYTDDEGDWYNYSGSKLGNNYIYHFAACPDVCIIYKIYNSEFKEFYSGELSEDYYSTYNGYIYLYNNNVIEKYNNKGELISKSKEYNNVKIINSNYVIYIKNDYLVLENIDDPTETKEIVEWNDNYFVDDLVTRYYSKEYLNELNEKDKKEGFYVVIYYGSKNSKGNYGMEYCYNKGEELVEYPIKQEMGGRAKPVLYLYPEKETNVTVKFEKPNLLTTTYPKYKSSWNVTVKPNGDMRDSDGKYYYALYWDEKRYNEVDFHEGFYVEGKDAISFLEEKLAIIGLNKKERNEFIMYWLPIMEANKKNLVYFELTEERELGNKLIITPKPDSLLRVSIHIKKVNKKVSIKEQKLPTFTRVGFTAVEWGGMTY